MFSTCVCGILRMYYATYVYYYSAYFHLSCSLQTDSPSLRHHMVRLLWLDLDSPRGRLGRHLRIGAGSQDLLPPLLQHDNGSFWLRKVW